MTKYHDRGSLSRTGFWNLIKKEGIIRLMTALEKFKQAYQGKRVLVMGLGLLGGGVGVAKFFSEIGAKTAVTDLKSEKELAASLEELLGFGIEFILGKHQEKDFQKADLIIRNPAVSRSSPFLEIARQAGVKIAMDTALFAKFCSRPMIGVTGTRGKTTTATLIYELLRGAGKEAILGGNVQSAASLPLLKKLRERTWVVLELSSWELQGFIQEKISPHIAVITNIYPDHLNRYSSLEEYITDKKAIFKYQAKKDFLIINQENKIIRKIARDAKSQLVWFQADDLPLDWRLRLPGRHNQANAAAAYQTGKILGLYPQWMRPVLETFQGVSFRLEKVAEIDGVKYINDTTSTTPEAAIAALDSLVEPIILLAGGASKNLDLDQLAEAIVKKTKAVALLEGTATDELETSIKRKNGTNKILGRFDDLKTAVAAARKIAQAGEVILLSPGCASFGMFVNEYDRGQKFNQIVKELTHVQKK